MMDLKNKTKQYLKQYEVEDVINTNLNYLFILESPHTAEITNGYPVAGNSGVEMTKFIYPAKSKQAFGKLVNNPHKYQKQYQGLDKFGIMNVVSAPMQSSALKEHELSTMENKILYILEKLRVNYQANRHRNQEWNKIKTVLIDDFAARLNNILSQHTLDYMIPCGKLAQNYLNLVTKNKDIATTAKIITGIPHPSRNQWRQYSSMKKLRVVLEKISFK